MMGPHFLFRMVAILILPVIDPDLTWTAFGLWPVLTLKLVQESRLVWRLPPQDQQRFLSGSVQESEKFYATFVIQISTSYAISDEAKAFSPQY
jgi:hypothetical protein